MIRCVLKNTWVVVAGAWKNGVVKMERESRTACKVLPRVRIETIENVGNSTAFQVGLVMSHRIVNCCIDVEIHKKANTTRSRLD